MGTSCLRCKVRPIRGPLYACLTCSLAGPQPSKEKGTAAAAAAAVYGGADGGVDLDTSNDKNGGHGHGLGLGLGLPGQLVAFCEGCFHDHNRPHSQKKSCVFVLKKHPGDKLAELQPV